MKKINYPTYQASKKTKLAYKQSLEDEKQGKLITPNNLSEFFESL